MLFILNSTYFNETNIGEKILKCSRTSLKTDQELKGHFGQENFFKTNLGTGRDIW